MNTDRTNPVTVDTLRLKVVVICGLLAIGLSVGTLAGCTLPGNRVPHADRWGIYALDLATRNTELIYSTSDEIQVLSLNHRGDTFAFAQKMNGQDYGAFEICTLGTDGSSFSRLTDNALMDVYPAWSPDDSRLAFLTRRQTDLDIYVMDADGSNPQLFYDSGSNDADIDWDGERIVFTAFSQIWTIQADGSDPRPVTQPPRAGEWGNTNLPFGDYDPRFSPDGTHIAFERLEGDGNSHGNYNFYVIGTDGSGETRLTDDGYSQGFAAWSHAGTRLLYVVAAVNDQGRYDMYMMNSDGSDNHDHTPGYFPATFLVHHAIFSADDSQVFFIGEWWE